MNKSVLICPDTVVVYFVLCRCRSIPKQGLILPEPPEIPPGQIAKGAKK